jgi:uncharacterized protein with FMN-binding domain
MRRVILAVVSTVAALVLLLSFKTHNATSLAVPPAIVASTTPSPAAPAPSAAATVPSTATSSAAAAPAPTTTTAKPKATKTAAPSTRTVTGDAVDTRYGPVQVQITVTNGKLTAANAIEYPQNERRDQEINSYAVPVLDKEALAAGSAKIDIVSGATYTSDGYATSLQSALDKAGA